MATATVINYCTNDYRFLTKCIAEAKHFSDQIIIPVCDHFFDGTPENRMWLDHTYAAHPDCSFIEFAYSPKQLYSPFLHYTPADVEWAHLWHSTARYIGFLHVRPEIKQILFLDCDEIPDGKRFAEWLPLQKTTPWNALYFAVFFYAYKAQFCAKKFQDLILLARRTSLNAHLLLHPQERAGTFGVIHPPKWDKVCGVDGLPLFHHYSWVRPEEECYRKAKTWAHAQEGGWEALIRQTFTKEKRFFGSTHEFEEIERSFFDPLQVEMPTTPLPSKSFPHVRRVANSDIFRIEIGAML